MKTLNLNLSNFKTNIMKKSTLKIMKKTVFNLVVVAMISLLSVSCEKDDDLSSNINAVESIKKISENEYEITVDILEKNSDGIDIQLAYFVNEDNTNKIGKDFNDVAELYFNGLQVRTSNVISTENKIVMVVKIKEEFQGTNKILYFFAREPFASNSNNNRYLKLAFN